MPLLRHLADIFQPTGAARRNLLLLMAVALLGVALTESVGLGAVALLSRALREADTAAAALRAHAEVDMMQDALRGDVFSLASGMERAREDFERHAHRLEAGVRSLETMDLPATLRNELRQHGHGLRSYVEAGRDLVAQAPPYTHEELETFTARWRELDAPLDATTQRLRSLVADVERQGRDRHRRLMVLMLFAFLAIVTALIIISGRLSRSVLAINAQLARLTEQALQAGRSRSEFLAAMSHEIRTPMTGVLGMVDLLGSEELTARQRSYVDAMRVSGRHLLAVISDILDFTRMESGRLELEQIDFSLPQLLEQIRSLIHPLANERRLALAIELAPDAPPMLCGDPTRLQQVLLNLCSNAVKFTERGGVRVQVVPVAREGPRWRLRFEVSDTGMGMTAETVAQLFSPFRQADQSIARRYGGSGLGLAICKRLVEAMGGQIAVRSTPGEGSVFQFELSLPEGKTPGAGAAATKYPVSARPLRILVAEDVEINREILRTGLERAGHTTVFARDGAEAVELARSEPFDLVLMDVQMPVMDGVEATRRIRNLPAGDMPIFALTANVMAQERETYLAAGMDQCLTKPIEWDQLLAAIDRQVARREASGAALSATSSSHEALAPADDPVTQVKASPLLDHATLDALAQMASRAELAEWLQLALDGYLGACKQMASAGNDAGSVTREAHKIKGSAGSLGLRQLHTLATALEQDAREGIPQGAQVVALEQAVVDTRKALQEAGFL
jgi:signal transduction histidine kinase/DNA-binding response OmpR family regulator